MTLSQFRTNPSRKSTPADWPGIPMGNATLTVSDWATDTQPGGPLGQELIYNFIEVQPYLED